MPIRTLQWHHSTHYLKKHTKWPERCHFNVKATDIMTNLSSPWLSGQCHWICLVTAYRGWSAATCTTGVCPGFNNSVVSLMLSITCFIVASECDRSSSRGKSEGVLQTHGFSFVLHDDWTKLKSLRPELSLSVVPFQATRSQDSNSV